jgi:hypothetical protein
MTFPLADDALVGMVHLPPLPGAPRFDGDRTTLRERAVADAETLVDGGVDAVMVENFGDAPFHPDEVPRHVVASMTNAVGRVVRAVDAPVGVNVLRNDARAAVAVAAAAGADFVRVNVHSGARVTDQGLVEGRAHETLRLRDRLDADVALLADVAVKHSAPLAGTEDLGATVADTVERGLADGLVVSGSGTGKPVDSDRLSRVVAERDALDHEVPVFVGSGVTPDTVRGLLRIADGAVVGTSLKEDRVTTNPVDPERVEQLVAATRE